MPGLSGAARQGRIMWLICDASKTVSLIWIYTHSEFEKRPADKDLKKVLEDAITSGLSAIISTGVRSPIPAAGDET